VLADSIARGTSKVVKKQGLNLSQWRVLAAIAEAPGRTSAEVVTITPMDKGIVSRATKALIDAQFVRRESSQLDGRLSYLHLTEAGVNLYEDLIPKVRALSQLAIEQLPAKRQSQLPRDLNALIEVIQEPG
jgi:DNA-binding MarR family transcriptional regulator